MRTCNDSKEEKVAVAFTKHITLLETMASPRQSLSRILADKCNEQNFRESAEGLTNVSPGEKKKKIYLSIRRDLICTGTLDA